MAIALRDLIVVKLDRVQIIKGWLGKARKTHEKIYDVAVSELATVWTDPDFDLNVKAFYYTRVLEIPTPRWVLYDKVTHGPLFGLPFHL